MMADVSAIVHAVENTDRARFMMQQGLQRLPCPAEIARMESSILTNGAL